MKLFLINKNLSDLSDCNATILNSIRDILFSMNDVEEVFTPERADAIIIQEENSFKNFKYLKHLESDDLISTYPEKIFTINTDDCATGLLRGLYTSLPKTRFNPRIFTSVPYMQFPNDLVFVNGYDNVTPTYLASWRGNVKSNKLRARIVTLLEAKKGYCIEKTNSWLNHNSDEKTNYVNLIRGAKFSLCPAGWAPVSFRIYESMALGRCPVILADDFVPPKGPDWNEFALIFPEKKLEGLPAFLLRHENQSERLGKNAFEAWKSYFSADVIEEYYAEALVNLIRSAPKTSRMTEFKRWNSLNLHWDNKWTLPQRVLNKVKKLTTRT
jgi:hypothetical protein